MFINKSGSSRQYLSVITPSRSVSAALIQVIPNIMSPTDGINPTAASALYSPKSYTWVDPGALEKVIDIFWDKNLKLCLAKL